jgi:Na+-driven multidrug efflux pump
MVSPFNPAVAADPKGAFLLGAIAGVALMLGVIFVVGSAVGAAARVAAARAAGAARRHKKKRQELDPPLHRRPSSGVTQA